MTTGKLHFDDEWKVWIWTNVGRGCSKDGIFKILYDEGFDYDAIKNELNHEPSVNLDEIAGEGEEAAPNIERRFIPNGWKFDSDRIDLYLIPEFLNADECNRLIDLMVEGLRPSTHTNESEPDPEYRTSKTSYFDATDDPLPKDVDTRMCRMLGIDPNYSEFMQGTLYDQGDQFKAHTDAFQPGTPEFEQYCSSQGQRTWTFMVYLNDVADGGETSFDLIDVTVKPVQGVAVVWNNLYPDGRPNPDTLHRALPPRSGRKAIITKWFRSCGDGVMNTKEEAEFIPNFTQSGISRAQVPEDLFVEILDFYRRNNHCDTDEDVEGGYIDGPHRHASSMIEMPEPLREKVSRSLQPLLEEWSDEDLEPMAVYGIRRYKRGAVLKMHRDRKDTHIISAIINVDQSVERGWPLKIEDNYYRSHELLLSPGEALFYEGARLAHGRPDPLDGEYVCNLFVHFKPKGFESETVAPTAD